MMSNERAHGMVANFGIIYLGQPFPLQHQHEGGSPAEAERLYAGAYLALHPCLYGKPTADPDFAGRIKVFASDTRKALADYRSSRAKRSR